MVIIGLMLVDVDLSHSDFHVNKSLVYSYIGSNRLHTLVKKGHNTSHTQFSVSIIKILFLLISW